MPLRRIVDLSHPLDATTTVYPGDPQVELAAAARVDPDGYNVLHVRMGSQSGTHVDAPYHFLDDGARIDEMDLALFLGPAVVIDVRHVGSRRAITWPDLAYVDALPASVAGRMVLLHTGWSRTWGTPAYFDHPYLDAGAAQELIDRGVRTVGVDAASVDETMLEGEHPTGFATHHVLLGAGCAIVENLTNLGAIDWSDPVVSVLPLRLTAADGAPVRAVAFEVADAPSR
jgi:kynurenine formamidase